MRTHQSTIDKFVNKNSEPPWGNKIKSSQGSNVPVDSAAFVDVTIESDEGGSGPVKKFSLNTTKRELRPRRTKMKPTTTFGEKSSEYAGGSSSSGKYETDRNIDNLTRSENGQARQKRRSVDIVS